MDWIHSALGVLLFRKFSRVVLSAICNLLLSGIALQGGFIGRIFDEFGPRVLMLVGTLIYVTSIMATSFATQYYQYILSQGILFGLGVGMLYVAASGLYASKCDTFLAVSTHLLLLFRRISDKVAPPLSDSP